MLGGVFIMVYSKNERTRRLTQIISLRMAIYPQKSALGPLFYLDKEREGGAEFRTSLNGQYMKEKTDDRNVALTNG